MRRAAAVAVLRGLLKARDGRLLDLALAALAHAENARDLSAVVSPLEPVTGPQRQQLALARRHRRQATVESLDELA